MMPNVKEGYEIPYEAGGFYVYETSSEVVKYWEGLPDAKKGEIRKKARAEGRDIREALEALI